MAGYLPEADCMTRLCKPLRHPDVGLQDIAVLPCSWPLLLLHARPLQG